MGFWKSVFKNTSWLLFGQTFAMVIAALYNFILARVLEPSGFGRYAYALSIFSLLMAVSDFGFNYFLMREVAKKPESAGVLGGTVTVLRIILSIIVFLLFSFVIFFIDHNLARVFAVLVLSLSIIPNGIAVTLDSLLKAREEMKESSVSFGIFRLTLAILGVVALILGFSLMGVVVTFFLSHVVYDLALLYYLHKRGVHLQLSFSLTEFTRISRQTLPYAILIVLGFVYYTFDKPILTYMRGEEETGYYAASYKFLDLYLSFIPTTFLTALFPLLSKLHEESKEILKATYFRAMFVLLAVSLPITAVLYFFAPLIIQIIYKQAYAPSAGLLRVLAFAIPFFALHTPGANLLFSSSKYLYKVIILSLFTTSFNLVANFIFIPIYGAYAAAYITVASEILSFVVFFIFIMRNVFATSEAET